MSATAADAVDGQVEVIVLDWDGGAALTDCLHSIDVQTQLPSRVIIVDNGSLVPVYQRLPKTLLKIPYVILRNETNLGFTGGINRAMSEVRAPFVAWVNNDAVLSEKWVEKLLPAVAGEGKVAGAQSIILKDKTTVDGAGISIEDGIYRQIGHGQKLARLRQVTQPWGVSGTAALFRTHALKDAAIHGAILRPDFFAYYEDVDLCARLRARGWKFKLVPEALTMHRGSSSAGRLGRAGFRMRTRNRYLVARSHPGVGSVSKLIGEDLSYATRELLGGHFRFALNRLRGMVEGLRHRQPKS
ncbi:MAG TPA: glycosyltransferase family 2 protein [Thermoanaerobaculia bacterium]|nr:glycosyltransferase family 2 protein [Thermoanaerobaculia bacterium]